MIDSRLEDRIDCALADSSIDRKSRICLLTAKQERKLLDYSSSGQHDKAEWLAKLLLNLDASNMVAFRYMESRYSSKKGCIYEHTLMVLNNALAKLENYDV